MSAHEESEESNKRSLSDKPKWWDTFPWWGVAIVAILFWMGYQIVTKNSYELAWDRVIPGISITITACLLYTSPSPRDVEESRMPSSA